VRLYIKYICDGSDKARSLAHTLIRIHTLELTHSTTTKLLALRELFSKSVANPRGAKRKSRPQRLDARQQLLCYYKNTRSREISN